jgi:phage gp37-like protein
MAEYTLTEIEDAIIEEIKKTSLGEYCETIDSYQLEEGEDPEQQIRAFVKTLPCCLVLFQSGEFSFKQMVVDFKPLQFGFLLAAQGLRTRGDARRGTVGVYQMIDDLRYGLTNRKCGLDISPLFPVNVAKVAVSRKFAAYAFYFNTAARYTDQKGIGL